MAADITQVELQYQHKDFVRVFIIAPCVKALNEFLQNSVPLSLAHLYFISQINRCFEVLY